MLLLHLPPSGIFGLWALYQTALSQASNIHMTSFNIAGNIPPYTSPFRLLPWNTAGCAFDTTLCRFQSILSAISTADANAIADKAVSVVCLQAVLKNQLDDLSKALGDDWAFIGVGQEDGLDKGEFVPILYRKNAFTVIDKQNRWISDTPEKAGTKFLEEPQPRVVTAVRFQIVATGKEFIIANNNLDDVPNKVRTPMFKVIADTVEKMRGGKAIPAALVGTFNFDSRNVYNLIYTDQGGSLAKYQDAYQMAKNKRSGPWATYYSGTSNIRVDFFWLGDKLSTPNVAKRVASNGNPPMPNWDEDTDDVHYDDDLTPGAYNPGTNVWTVSSYNVSDDRNDWGLSNHRSLTISASFS